MVDRVRDRRRSSDNADFTDALDAEWIDFVVLPFDDDHVDRVNIAFTKHIRRNSESAGSQYQEIFGASPFGPAIRRAWGGSRCMRLMTPL